ncbi:MAG: hypothetical protein KH138_05720 [Firmicutes bacterium]|nr:hypothetical protein [Bacillota bacterium]
MKVEGGVNPLSFVLEEMPRKPGYVLIRMRENAKKQTEITEGGRTDTWWEYDEYTLEMPESNTLDTEVEANFAGFLATAKKIEKDALAKLELVERVEQLKAENKVLNAQAGALSEQNDFQEELIVELANIVYA